MSHFYSDSSGVGESGRAGKGFAEHCLIPLVAVSTLYFSSSALAQDAAPIKLGETQLTPAVRIDYLSIDNLYRESTNEVSGSAVVVKPELVWRADRRLLSLEAQYNGDYAVFSEDGLDYDNHRLSLQAVGDLSSKQRLVGTLSFVKTTEEQGTGQTIDVQGPLDEQIEISSVNAAAAYTYGSADARGNLRFGVSLGSVSYANLEQFTDGDDYSVIRPFTAFSLRLSPDTRLLAEARFGVLDYDNDDNDRTELSFLTGVELSSSSKLSGEARIGVVTASFDVDSDDDTTALIAEIGLLYTPVSYSEFRIDFDRGIETEDQNADNTGTTIYDYAAFTWSHDWSSRFQTVANLNFANADRDCPTYDYQTVGAGLELNLQVRRWLQVGISGAQSSRSISTCSGTTADLDGLEYDRSVIGAHVRATL